MSSFSMIKLARWLTTSSVILIILYLIKLIWLTYGYFIIRYWACMLGLRSPQEDRRFQRYMKRDFDMPPFRQGYTCLPLKVKPSPIICIHNPEDDVFISGSIYAGSCWEEHIVSVFQKILNKDKELGVIDVGANIGQYSLLAAKMGHQVIAIEPYSLHVDLLHESVNLNKLQDNVILLHNAVSDSYRDVIVHIRYHNLGAISIIDSSFDQDPDSCKVYQSISHAETILLDDIINLLRFEKAIMKIDIEGHEPRAILHSNQLFEKLYIPYIFMEWEIMLNLLKDEEQAKSVRDMCQFLAVRGYDGYSIYGEFLQQDDPSSWPSDIIWKHKEAAVEYIKFSAGYYL